MTKDDNAPVTRKDLKKELQTFKAELRDEFATKEDLKRFATKEDLKRFATKEDLQDLRVGLKKEILQEIKHYFDLTVENIRHDLLGTNRDEIEVIKDRVTRLEQHTGLAA